MAYMSYCRFEGTLHELRACMADVEEHVNEIAEYSVSDGEIRQFKQMVIEFTDFLHDMGVLNDEGYLERDTLNEVCDAMAKSYDGEDEE